LAGRDQSPDGRLTKGGTGAKRPLLTKLIQAQHVHNCFNQNFAYALIQHIWPIMVCRIAGLYFLMQDHMGLLRSLQVSGTKDIFR
jgi:hypothetical protein